MATVDMFVAPLPDDGSDVWDYYLEQPIGESDTKPDAALISWGEAADKVLEQRGGRDRLLEDGSTPVSGRLSQNSCYLQISSKLDADESEALKSALEKIALEFGLFCIDPLSNIARLPDGKTIEYEF